MQHNGFKWAAAIVIVLLWLEADLPFWWLPMIVVMMTVAAAVTNVRAEARLKKEIDKEFEEMDKEKRSLERGSLPDDSLE